MAKVFTITTGLENMGAMKSGGQGSVYKGRRIGEIITAVKLLPTPIFNESYDDRNYRDFQNEVQKLKKVNEKPNPNIVKIFSSGLSETGNFPFIEMEYIEGPDLEDLLKPPNEPVFTIKEVIKVAEHLSNALAQCHRLDVKHGDIKSNNIKFNINTSNYVLLDFGLAAMSDEQRRTSLRQAGAVEFMAPEQNEGNLLFETDVYSFGVILFELLAGTVPFPLHDKGETARNTVRLAHLETLPPDMVTLRKEALPATWSAEKKNREAVIPDWLIKLVYKCLKKSPENRFSNGMELQNYIVYNSTHALPKEPAAASATATAAASIEKQQLQQQILQYRHQLDVKQKEIDDLKARSQQKAFVPEPEKINRPVSTNKKGFSKNWISIFILLALGLATYAAFSFFQNNSSSNDPTSKTTPAKTQPVTVPAIKKENKKKKVVASPNIFNATDSNKALKRSDSETRKPQPGNISYSNEYANNDAKYGSTVNDATSGNNQSTEKYTVNSIAHFYNAPDENTMRPAFINHWNKAVLIPQSEENGFIYVVYKNSKGQTSKGWMRKSDLRLLDNQ